MMPKLRNAALAFYVVLLIGWLTHLVSSGFVTVGVLIVSAILLVSFLQSRFSSANRAANRQAASSRSASLAEVPPPGSGFVFVYRQGGGLIVGPLLQVAVDGGSPVALKNAQFTRLTVSAGQHRLAARVAGESVTGQNLGAEAAFTIAAAESLFYATSTTMSVSHYTAVLTRDTDARSATARLAGFTQVAS